MALDLPSTFKGMTQLDRERFTRTVSVPCVTIPVQCIQSSKWKDTLLILTSFKCVRDLEPATKTHKQVLFNPDLVRNSDDLIQRIPSIKDHVEKSFDFTTITITYKNYSIEQVLKAIVPDDKRVNNGSGYSLIGHIAHFNLRDEVLPYKHVIGKIIAIRLTY
jgi:tRNA (guanine37-N1)-methyltransferase